MNKRILLRLLILILSISFLSGYAQTTTQNLPSQNTDNITPFSVIEIPQKIDEAHILLKQINSIEIPATEINNLEESFKSFLNDNETLKKESTEKILSKTTTKKLKDYNKKWKSYLINLTEFKNTLEEASARLDQERETINNLLLQWNATYINAKKEKAPKQLINRTNSLIKEIKKTDKELFAILTQVLSLRDKVSDEEVTVNETLSLIKNQIESNRSLLFTFDSAPLWVALSDTSDTTTFAQNINSSIVRINKGIVEFWDMYSEEFPYYISFYLFVLVILIYLKRFANKTVGDRIIQNDKYSVQILNKPFSIALLIAIYFELLFFPYAPTVISELSRILLVIPIIILFPTFISKASRGPLYFITFLYLLQQIIELSIGNSIYLRLFTILLTILMIVGLNAILKIDTKGLQEKRIKTIKILRVISKLLIVILSIALLGNISGNTALSTLIFSGVMRTIYSSLIIITSLQVFYTLLTILLETRILKVSLIVQRRSEEVKKTLFTIVRFIVVVVWSIMFLRNFEIYDSVESIIITLFTTPLEIGNFSITITDITLFFLAVWFSTKLSKVIRFIFENEISARVKLPRGVPAAISTMISYTIITLGFLVALSFIGFDLEKFAIIAGALGVGIGFGLQNIVNNFISGLILLFERPIQVGDTISLPNQLVGSVKKIGIRASIVQTFDGSEVIVPNADLISGQVTNWTLSDSMRRIEIKIGVHFDADPNKVMNILTEALEGRDDILKYPAPYILYKGHHESTQNFDLRFWTSNSGDWIFIRSDVLLKITKMLQDAEIEIPYQQQNVYIKEIEKSKDSE